ncbi:MAG: hypothetical protein HY300_13900 [Verrucomicrobia bacterium]|nr:hypothetical protein [Verrucomicrobiota bacterium]
MKTLTHLTALSTLSVAASLLISAGNIGAQDRPGQGNFDPEQMRQRMLDRVREQLEVKDDAEWKVISERIGKVMEARRATGGPGGFGGPGGLGGPGAFRPPNDGGQDGVRPQRDGGQGRPGGVRGGPDGQGGGRPQGERGQGGPGGPGGFNRESNPEAEALQKAIQANAPAEEIKAKLTALRDARKASEAKLEKAQDELRTVLSARQEAIAVTMGVLK